MVRRLKEDIRATQGGFPERRVERVVIDGLPSDAAELELSRLLESSAPSNDETHDLDRALVVPVLGMPDAAFFGPAG